MMERRSTWPEDLARHFDAVATRPWAWGSWDCCLAACDAVRAMTGEDLGAPFRGRYSTPIEAACLCREFLGGDLEAAVAKVLEEHGLEEIPPARAGRGDLVLVRLEGGRHALGIIDLRGTHVAIASRPRGLAFLPRRAGAPGATTVHRAWKVGP